MKTTKTPVASEAKVTATKTTTPKTGKRIATARTAKQDIKPEAKKVLDTKNLKDTIKTAVVSQREVKWKYPEDVNGPDRKPWRAQQRAKLTKLEAAITTAKDDKARKANEKALTEFRKEVLLVP